MVTKFLREDIIPKTDEEIILQTEADKKAGIAALQAGQMLADDTYQLAAAATKPFRDQGPIEMAMKIPSLATEEGRQNLGNYMLDLIDFEKYGRPIDKFTGYMEEDDPEIKTMREALYYGSIVPSIPSLLRLGLKISRFAAPVVGPAIPFIAAGSMGEAEAAGFKKAIDFATDIKDLSKVDTAKKSKEAKALADSLLPTLSLGKSQAGRKFNVTQDQYRKFLSAVTKDPSLINKTADEIGKILNIDRNKVPLLFEFSKQNRKIQTRMGKLEKSGQEIVDLYDDIIKGKIDLSLFPRATQGEISLLTDYATLSPKNQALFRNQLNNFNNYLKIKGNRLNKNELVEILNKKLGSNFKGSSFRTGSNIVAEGRISNFNRQINEILKVERSNEFGMFYKNPTDADFKKIKAAYATRSQPQIRTITLDYAPKFATNKNIQKIIKEERRLPSLLEIQKEFPELGPDTIATIMTRYIQKMNGVKFTLPTNRYKIKERGGNAVFDSEVTAAEKQAFNNIRTNKKLANTLLAQFSKFDKRSPYRKQYYLLNQRSMDLLLDRPEGQIFTLTSKAKKILKDNKAKPDLEIHEPASVTVAVTNKVPSYGNFIIPLEKSLNEGIVSTTQAELSRQLSLFKNGEINFKTLKEGYNKIIKRYEKNYPELKGKLAFIMDPNKKAIEAHYGANKVKQYKELYNMDLVKEAKEAGFALKLPKNAIPLEQFVEKGGFGYRVFKAEGGRVGFVTGGLSESIKEVQEEIKERTQPLRETISEISKPYAIKTKEVLDDTAEVLNKNKRPAEFRIISDGYKLITESPIVKSLVALPSTGQIAALETIETIYNKIRPGVENDIEMEEKFPALYGVHRFLTQSVGKTPDDQTYISIVDEINRAQETGFTRLGYNIADLVASSIDGVNNRTEFTERVRESYDKSVKEGRFTEPETFLGEVSAIAVEFGAPGGAVFKGVNAARRFIGGVTGFNLFTTPTYSLKGGKWLATKISNVAKRAGTSATVFGATDIIAGGPYNTVSAAFNDDPLLFDESLGYDYEDTTGLSGKELAIANFKNRLRFGADGAIIGGLFPLVGPPLWLATKFGVIKPVTGLTKGVLRVGDELAVKPLTYLASGTLKAPLSKPGQLEVQVPLLGEAVQGVGSGVKIFADFLGKDVITRAAVTAMGAKPGLVKQLPDFKDWRMFDVNSDDPLKRNLKKIDNVFSFFREAGPRSANQLFLDVEAQNFIRSKQRQIEKLIDSIERKSYDLANGFLRRYNTSKTSPAGQQYILDQTLAYLKGQIKLNQLEPEIQEAARALNKEFIEIRTLFRDVLPEGSGLRDFLTMNLGSYMRQSFGVFTNPQFKPDPELVEKAAQFIKGRIEKNASLVELAIKGSTKSTDEAVMDFARAQVRDLLATAKSEGFDPIIQLQKIAKENLKLDDLVVQTGEELPTVIRKLLGEEESLRSSVLQTTSSLLTQAVNLKNYERIGELLLREGRLFASRDEAIAAGITNPLVVGRVPGLGLLESGITNLYGSREVTDLLRGTGGMLDKFMQNSIYQSMIAYKAGVQTGKTVLSPATQSRNFLSAGAFVLNNGWIGGKASVTDAFKIVLDDVFGAGRVANEVDLINNIARKAELGVIDENIVASELSAVLSDIKSGKIGTIAQLTTRADDSALMKTATRLYSGGDNVWKWYAHEYLMSQLKGAFKNVDEVKRAVLDDFGIDVFNPKNLSEAVEEYSALLVRELMPTYSKVPPVIQAIRKIPFFGNFVSFPAEILRTSVATSALAMKHVASDNPTLRAIGLRSLAGQGLTLYGLNEGAKALGHAFTNVTPEQIKTYKEEFGPAFMRFSELIPISNIDEKKGTFKVFDMSRFNPYDLVTSTANNLLVRATDPQATLDPSKIKTDVFKSYLDASGPLLDLVNGTLLGFSIGFEGIAEIFEGKTKQGSPIYSESDRDIEKLDKAITHLLKKDEPGIISTGRRILNALAQDVTGTGQLIKLEDEGFKLAGGSAVTIDVPGSFAYKISEFKNTFKDAKVSEGFYSTKNYQQRGPAQLVREYNQQNEEAFREQYRFYRATRAALDSGLMNRSQVIKALQARDLSGETIQSILSGRFVPLSYGKDALIGRYNKIKAGQPDKRFSISDFVPVGALEKVKNKWRKFKFEDFERERKEPIDQTSALPKLGVEPEEEKIVTPQLPQSPDPAPPLAQAADVIPATGLTTTETALLSPSDQVIRQRQRGIV